MIENPELVRRLEDRVLAGNPADFGEQLALYEEMWRHACLLGALPAGDALEGIEVDVRLARALNVRGAA